jgi:hypothetical protein
MAALASKRFIAYAQNLIPVPLYLGSLQFLEHCLSKNSCLPWIQDISTALIRHGNSTSEAMNSMLFCTSWRII